MLQGGAARLQPTEMQLSSISVHQYGSLFLLDYGMYTMRKMWVVPYILTTYQVSTSISRQHLRPLGDWHAITFDFHTCRRGPFWPTVLQPLILCTWAVVQRNDLRICSGNAMVNLSEWVAYWQSPFCLRRNPSIVLLKFPHIPALFEGFVRSLMLSNPYVILC